MKKNTIKAFTLVEMLIVIVIIGILIAALMPRMQQAQSRARDVTRKNDLAQMQTAIISYYGDTSKLPDAEGAVTVDNIAGALKAGGLDKTPDDPIEGQDYYYGVTKRNTHENQGFRLAANMEVAGVANFEAENGGSISIDDTANFEPSTCSTEGQCWYVIVY